MKPLNNNTNNNIVYFTPALVYHVPQFLEKCGGLSIFNCQPVEKKNHQQSRMFHQVTQKGGGKSSYTKQVMENENRKIYARVNNLYRTKRAYQRGGHTEEDPGALHLYIHQSTAEDCQMKLALVAVAVKSTMKKMQH